MIRGFQNSDMETVLDIWLQASIKAHHFVHADYWKSQLNNMRNIYIPASETYVYEVESRVVGFYALNENILAAVFVLPTYQGQGIGKALLAHAKSRRQQLTLSVYKENESSYRFYLSQGFEMVSEQLDQHTGHPEYTMKTAGT